jgi:uncharacterized protein
MSEPSPSTEPIEPGVSRAPVTTEEVSFPSGDASCAATLYRPVDRDGPVPCVVMVQGFSLTRQDGAPRYAEAFARSGFAALTFDFRSFGDSTGEPRQLVDHELQRQDAAAAVCWVRALDGIDPDRIVLWGYSFGGGHVLHVAAEDPRLAAAVLHFPMVDGLALMRMMGTAASLRVTGAMLRALVGRRLVRIGATGPPGSLAILTQEEAEPGFHAVRGQGSGWRNDVRTRPTQPAAAYRPVTVAGEVACPTLVCLGERDTIVAPKPIVRTADRAPKGELRRYDVGHFGPFLSGFDEVLADQVAFLDRHVG